ncbi:hypothetical protein SMGD1_1393 [Sulfurimonas gotlandica GD1]|jgi:hypothetical protein|uniref:Lipoprotein n=1 Tax=Sulfurimonas gotlandica (strain DSM 19862 / JCM 16533 / GD1) TaxID=929558 RepID=B6BHC3_SULGG|nr:hypothetical protein [Sulfurimonas gotlandica]EDZ63720.1 conserved hypothetical protein [Sulfurimonas gotlandica GD1]EHP29917.1 hypothetical protein SMGD1_1393 [Sulfurimonas gotlandica GD1]
MKKTLSVLVLFFTTLIMLGCGPAKLTPAQQTLVDSQASLYTQVAMWTEKNKVQGLNFSRGLLIPINAQVKIISASNNGIVFKYLGAEITYTTSTKYTKIDTSEMLNRLFAKSTVDLSKYDEAVKENIKNGKVVVGMTKDEVLLARGYPPLHQTLSLKADLWKYWDHRFKTSQYKFQDNRVVEIIGGAT